MLAIAIFLETEVAVFGRESETELRSSSAIPENRDSTELVVS